MKKTLVVILTVAILGLLGLFAENHRSSNQAHLSTVKSGTSASILTSSQPPAPPPPPPAFHSNAIYNYKDGTFVGSIAQTPYGSIQVTAIISGSKIIDIQFLEMPKDQDYSREISTTSEPLLEEATIALQSAKIAKIPDFVSGATSTVKGYQESLQAALDKAAPS